MKQLIKTFSVRVLMLLFFFTLLPAFANAQCPDNNHPHMIDLGLPSGTKWACCNVGASKPEDYGGYYAWGETDARTLNDYSYNWDLTEGITNISGTSLDVAYVKWGSPWHIPSHEQIDELCRNTTYRGVVVKGVEGCEFMGDNGKTIFLPATKNAFDYYGLYWSSEYDGVSNGPWYLRVNPSGAAWVFADSWGMKNNGLSVRPVITGSSTPSGIAIDETNFPDENFRNWVLAQEYGQDGVLMEEEIATVTYIDLYDNGITNLKGIEFFTALTYLDCSFNQLTSLDVSKNTALENLDCYDNQLTSLDVSKNTMLEYFYCHCNELTSLNVSNNTALKTLWCQYNQLSTLDVSTNTALKNLICDSNQLTKLDVSKNMALTELGCSINQLNTLDVSKNTALTELWCADNQLTSLDFSKNSALTQLSCGNNQLTSLDVSKNTALTVLRCEGNKLTSLEVSANTKLTELRCYNNRIKGASMDALIAGLPEGGGKFYPFDLYNSGEQNVVTKAQVAAAKIKKWITYYWNAESQAWLEYEGSESEVAGIEPVEQGETIDIGNELDANTDLDGNVVGDVYYCISSGDGSYDPEEGCLVVTKPTEDSAIDGKDIFGEDFKDGYTGFVFMVAPGKGTINVEAETTGNMVLKVKVGENSPTQMEVDGKTKVSFSYDVSEPTMVFIYGSIAAAGSKGMRKVSGTDMLKIYGIEVTSETNGIKAIDNGQLTIDNSPVYNLNGQRVISSPSGRPGGGPTKGIYIQNGKKVLVK
jgi:Leucine-rich repeat (LRR) protein